MKRDREFLTPYSLFFHRTTVISYKESIINKVQVGEDNSINYNNNSIIIYPNPTNGLINIELYSLDCKILLFSVDGKLLLEKNAISKNESIDLSTFDSGIYIIRIISDTKTFEQKINKL